MHVPVCLYKEELWRISIQNRCAVVVNSGVYFQSLKQKPWYVGHWNKWNRYQSNGNCTRGWVRTERHLMACITSARNFVAVTDTIIQYDLWSDKWKVNREVLLFDLRIDTATTVSITWCSSSRKKTLTRPRWSKYWNDDLTGMTSQFLP